MQSEAAIIAMLKKKFNTKSKDVVLGVGDDAAVIKTLKDKQFVVTCDSHVEGVHFQKAWLTPQQLGKRAIAVAVSDIVAMGAEAKYVLVSLLLPKNSKKSFVDELFNGISSACKAYDVQLVGGNLSSAAQIVVDVTVIGVVDDNKTISRSGAKPGDVVCVTGIIGDAAAGLQILKRCHSDEGQNLGPVCRQAGIPKQVRDDMKYLLGRFTSPTPRLKEGQIIVQYATAMIDISDGLVVDIGKLCGASRIGACLFEEKIPKKSGVPLAFALYGGEDYELCFTGKEKDVKEIIARVKRETGTMVTVIGKICSKSKGFTLIKKNGKKEVLSQKGWDHFS